MTVIHAHKNINMGQSFMDNYGRNLKKTSWVTAINMITGEEPIVNEYDDHTDIEFTPSQVKFLQNKLTEWEKADPGEVRVNVKPVIVPWAVKKYWPWAVGSIVAGFILGKIT